MVKLSLRGNSEELEEVLKHIHLDEGIVVVNTNSNGKIKDLRMEYEIELKDDAEDKE